MTSRTRIATSSTARKVVGSLGVLGTAAAVAGMGTFGNITDSTTPVATTIQSGTLSIALYNVAAYSVRYTVTTQTDVGSIKESASSGWLRC